MPYVAGETFDHPSVINSDGTPMRYRITKIAHRVGVIYIKPVDGGHSSYVAIDQFENWVNRKKKAPDRSGA